jgi:hypothetical protein
MQSLSADMDIGPSEGILEMSGSVLLLSEAGATGLSSGVEIATAGYSTKTQALKPDANTNLMYQRTLIPVINRDVERDIQAGEEFVFVTHVFAISARANSNKRVSGLAGRWADSPLVSLSSEEGVGSNDDCIILD